MASGPQAELPSDPQPGEHVDSLVILIGVVLALIILDAAAAAFGVDTRDGFAEDCDSNGLN